LISLETLLWTQSAHLFLSCTNACEKAGLGRVFCGYDRNEIYSEIAALGLFPLGWRHSYFIEKL
jgi:hypothetical protein